MRELSPLLDIGELRAEKAVGISACANIIYQVCFYIPQASLSIPSYDNRQSNAVLSVHRSGGGGPSVPYVPSNAAQCHPHNLENAETPWACVCVCVWDSSTSSWDWISCRRRHENPLLPDSFPHNHDESSVPIAVLVTDYPRFLTLSAASPTLDPGHLGVASRRCLLV